jgi:hypothetical protein
MVEVQKSKLVECLNMVPLTPTANYTALIDMGFIWRVALPTAEDREKQDGSVFTWQDYAAKMFRLVICRHASASMDHICKGSIRH